MLCEATACLHKVVGAKPRLLPILRWSSSPRKFSTAAAKPPSSLERGAPGAGQRSAAPKRGYVAVRGGARTQNEDPKLRALEEEDPKLHEVVAAQEDRKEAYAYMTPSFRKTQRKDLVDNWDNLGFSIRPMHGHVRFTWKDGTWDQGVFVPAPYQLLHINSGALHYGISVFEGLKAFAGQDGKVRLMNPELNAQRMERGAERLCMPEVPKELFVSAVTEAVRRNRDFVPPYGHGASMYVRPLLFASGQMLGLAPLASEYTFFVTVLPAGGYFGKGAEAGVDALVSEDHDRAAPKGTGNVKAGGNYAADLSPVHAAHGMGYNTTLYLDAKEKKYIEEFSVCNFVGITHDGKYVTPKSDTILKSTTNIMLQQLARDRGLVVEERPVDFDKEIGLFKEVGMCGTAAVVVKVASITRNGHTHRFEHFDTIASLREEFTGIQCGEVPDRHGWMTEVCDVYDEQTASLPPLTVESRCEGMIDAESTGLVQRLGSELVHGVERRLLEHVISTAAPGDPESVLSAMDGFWRDVVKADGSESWHVRGNVIEEQLLQKISEKAAAGQPIRCLELGTYCGYSALRIARHLPEGSALLSVERDALFGAIATKIVEFAGLQDRVKIWMGTVHSELGGIMENLDQQQADFLLCDHSKERFVPDLKLLEECGAVGPESVVVGDIEVYPGDQRDAKSIQDIEDFFADRDFVLASVRNII